MMLFRTNQNSIQQNSSRNKIEFWRNPPLLFLHEHLLLALTTTSSETETPRCIKTIAYHISHWLDVYRGRGSGVLTQTQLTKSFHDVRFQFGAFAANTWSWWVVRETVLEHEVDVVEEVLHFEILDAIEFLFDRSKVHRFVDEVVVVWHLKKRIVKWKYIYFQKSDKIFFEIVVDFFWYFRSFGSFLWFRKKWVELQIPLFKNWSTKRTKTNRLHTFFLKQ